MASLHGNVSFLSATCRQLQLAGLAMGMMAAASSTALAVDFSQEKITVREYLGKTHGRERVTYPFTAAENACPSGSLTLTGPDGAVPVQLSRVEYWSPDKKAVKSAELTFIVESLKPGETRAYAMKSVPGTATPAGVTVREEKGFYEITTDQIGLRMARGTGALAKPVAMKDIPAPLSGMRSGQGAWNGGSAFAGTQEVTAWETTLTDSGPVFASTKTTYTFTDGNVLTLIASVSAGDNTVHWDIVCKEDRADASLALTLASMPGVEKVLLPKGYGQWAKDRDLAIKASGDVFAKLSPNCSVGNIWQENPPIISIIAFKGNTQSELRLESEDPGIWSPDRTDLTYAGFAKWELDNIDKRWDVWKRCCIPVRYGAKGEVTLEIPLTQGERKWFTAVGAPAVGSELNTIKDMVLDWPADPKQPHPRLFVDGNTVASTWQRAAGNADLAAALAGGYQYASVPLHILGKPADKRTPDEVKKAVDHLAEKLGLLGRFDVMRGAIGTVSLYDAMIDSELVPAAQKPLFRAQMAYLGYLMADPMCWSMERGYLSGNPNMSLSYTLSLGTIACALRDHPMAKTWSDYATRWMDKWLTDDVGPNGEWICEGAHYGHVSLEPLVTYAVAAKRAGFHDFSNDPRLQKMVLYFARYHTPRDMRRKDKRYCDVYGRGAYADANGVFGVAAAFYKDSNPELSQTLQWLWAESGYPCLIADSRLGGFEPYYQDRSLPAKAPAWTTEIFPELGVLCRHAFNTPNESYLNLITADSLKNLDIWAAGIGGINHWYGRGKPLSTCFTVKHGYNDRHELLRDGVRLARNWGAPGDSKTPFGHYTTTRTDAFATFAPADYSRTRYENIRVDNRDWFVDDIPAFPKVKAATGTTLDWTRQLLFVKDPETTGPAWFLVRDTTSGGQPTAWQFWTLSEKIGTPKDAKNADAFLADKPGRKILPASALPSSDRYTAFGQYGVDVEFFIASPAKTDRHTLRFGGETHDKTPEYQDALLLQQPGDGTYMVAAYPHPRAEAMPEFTASKDDRAVKVTVPGGTDYAFLSFDSAKTSLGDASFEGTAASIQERGAVTALTLAAEGTVACRKLSLAAQAPVCAVIADTRITLSLAAEHPETTVTLAVPGAWTVSGTGATLAAGEKGTVAVTVAKGVTNVVLTAK